MARLKVVTSEGKKAGTVDVKDTLVGADINLNAVRQCVNAHLANRRRGTANTKGRSDVRGGGAKPWRQKGTGRARAGTASSPIWRGGGVVFGPKPRSFRRKVNRKVRRLAFRSVLTDRKQADRLTVVDSLTVEDGRLKTLEAILGALGVVGKTLIVTADSDTMVQRASRNRPGLNVQVADAMNVYEVLCHDNLVVTRGAIERMEEMWG